MEVVPPTEVLEQHARRLIARRLVAARIAPLISKAEAEVATIVQASRPLLKVE